jgi:catechol 2,3-dioxygenase-like lactoylglutathione lyase family enzyme
MIDHLSTYATDYPATRAFYGAVFGALGYAVQSEFSIDADEALPGRRVCMWGPSGRSIFGVVEVKSAFEPRHVAFTAADRASVDLFHAVGLEAGGIDHGAPGLRPIYHANYYGAFLLDPDGNNVEAVCHASVV